MHRKYERKNAKTVPVSLRSQVVRKINSLCVCVCMLDVTEQKRNLIMKTFSFCVQQNCHRICRIGHDYNYCV